MNHPVVLGRCENYDEKEVCRAVERLLDEMGADDTLEKGQKILLKPNLLAADPAPSGTCPHPSVIYAVGKWLQQRGANLLLSDSAAFGSARGAARKSGIKEAADRLGIPVVEMRKTTQKASDLSFNRLPSSFTLAQLLDEVDGVVNLPKLKVHGQLLLSLAVKNLYGFVPGKRKAWRHLLHGRSEERFSEMLVAHAHLVTPKLCFTVMDAVDAMERKGPRGGEMRRLKTLVGGRDVFALDAAVCLLVGVNPSLLSTVAASIRAGLVPEQLDQIPLRGEPMENLRVEDFKLPEVLSPIGFSPIRIVRSTYRHIRVLLQQRTSGG